MPPSRVAPSCFRLRRWGRCGAFLALLPLVLAAVPQQRPQPQTTDLTADERAWLSRGDTIRWGVAATYAPFESVNYDGTVEGYTPALFDYLIEGLGLRIDTVYSSSWTQLARKIERGEVDLVTTIVPNPKSTLPLRTTQPYLTLPDVLITRQSLTFIETFEDLAGMRLAVGENWAVIDYLQDMHPDIRLHFVSDVREALRATAFGEVDALIATLPNASYYIEREQITNLRVSGPTPYDVHLTFGVRPDWPELHSILNKAIAAVPETVEEGLADRWIRFEQAPSIPTYWRWVVLGLVGSILALGGVWIWNRALRRQVLARTHDLVVAKERAEEARRLTESFLANVSHEVRTPLTSILGFAEALDEELEEDDNRWMTGVIRESGTRLLRTMDSVLELSVLETSASRLHTETFDLREVVLSLAKVWGARAHAQGLDFFLNLPSSPTLVSLDQAALERILENLVQNAFKFTPEGSVTVRAELSGDRLLLEVQDTGVGIDPAFRDKMFDAFRQESEGIRRDFEGVGLGLTITKRLVTLMEGDLEVESEKDRGTCIRVHLPRRLALRGNGA